MKEFEDYYKEIVENAISNWKKDKNDAFDGLEKDPVVKLLLSALTYQSFQIRKDIDRYQENTVQKLKDRLIPYHLIKPKPSFSIAEIKLIKDFSDDYYMIDENAVFEFSQNKKRYKFSPLFKTKIINAVYDSYHADRDNTITVELASNAPLKEISGMSIYIETENNSDFDIEVWHNNQQFPLIKPEQYHELPFLKWFNNNHLLLKDNHYLFGNYDYWQEIFLTNGAKLYYIDKYDLKNISLDGKQDIQLELVFSSEHPEFDISGCNVKINCVPIVNVEKNELRLTHNHPIQSLSSSSGEFLNLLIDNKDKIQEKLSKFTVRQYGIERYNKVQLLYQLEDLLNKYVSDYYAFRSVGRLKNSDKLERLHEDLKTIYQALNENKDNFPASHYAVMKLSSDLETRKKDLYIEYLCTAGAEANGIQKDEKVVTAPPSIDKVGTRLLLETKGGHNVLNDNEKKDEIAKYYFLTKDRLVTIADIRAFCYKELGSKIEKLNIDKINGSLEVNIILNEDERLLTSYNEKIETAILLERKIKLHSANMIPIYVKLI